MDPKKLLTVDNINNIDEYADQESSVTEFDQQIVDFFKEDSENLTNKSQIISNLEEIKEIIIDNKNDLDARADNSKIAKNKLQDEIDEINQSDVLNQLIASGINEQILSICIAQFNIANYRIQELRYRQEILSYKIIFINKQKQLLDNNIELINKYIIALKEG